MRAVASAASRGPPQRDGENLNSEAAMPSAMSVYRHGASMSALAAGPLSNFILAAMPSSDGAESVCGATGFHCRASVTARPE
jgi:hypothetical protein